MQPNPTNWQIKILIYYLFIKDYFSCFRQSLVLSSTLDNVDLIYNGLSDKYETLYPYTKETRNEGGTKLLTKEELGNKQVRALFSFFHWKSPVSMRFLPFDHWKDLERHIFK